MRDLLTLISPLFETPEPTIDELEAMKAVIAGKIKQLPADAETAKATLAGAAALSAKNWIALLTRL